MSKVVNNEGIRPGCIYRIALENFVTYKQVVLFPGPSLNMIIGPNGTGKSTFVCAIILGLCGKTSAIGRAKKISEYVRSGCEQATIEIELYQKPGKRNVIITRHFNLNDVSTWSIDNKTVKEKQVQDLIASLNIQVDNLCQLLPQDRVQDFSKMDAQQLLRSTLAAVGGAESVQQLDELIETRNQQRGLNTKRANNEQVLQEQMQLNERLKLIIDAMQQRKDIENQIEICEKKKLWLEYQDLREKVIEYTNDKKQAVKLVNTHRSKMEPLQKVIEKAKSGISKLEQQKLMANREIHTLRDKAKDIIKSVRDLEYTLKDIEASFQEKMERHRNRERELAEASAKLDKLRTDKEKLEEEVGDTASVKMDLDNIVRAIQKCNAGLGALKKQKLEIQYDLENNIVPQIRLYQNRIRNLEDVDIKRLEALRSYSEDAYKAVMWLRENRDSFQHAVYEPMMLEINFTDPKFARYLESTVPARDLVAFTFESSSDMNLFLQKVRSELGLRRVNAVCSQGGSFNMQTNNIQQLSYLGFYTYLADTITAPDPIVRYLCKQYGIHRIPIGNEHTYNNSGRVPANITFFYTEKHRFSVRVSAYSGAKSSSTTEVRPARLLANTVDGELLENYNKQLSNFDKNASAHKARLQELDHKISSFEVTMNEFNTKRKHINDGIEKVRTISAQIRLQAQKVTDIENEPTFNVVQERERSRGKQRECVLKQCGMQAELCGVVKMLQGKQMNGDIWKVKLDFSRDSIVQQETELRELKNELSTVQATLENIDNLLARSKSTAKEKLLEAKRCCNNKLPQDPDFPYKEQFEVLPADVTSLQEHYYELQTRMDCMEQGDEQVVKEYEEREKVIARLRAEVTHSSDTNKLLENKMQTLKQKWLPPLESLLRNIDKSFGDMFAKLGCAGEIKLEKAGSDEDYDKYGIGILVSFRASEALQRLTRHAQSGGERALCTALYLMALQALTTVPFRCVDEINQGMDPINERKMFQLLVKVTTECDNAQYFLLTPKVKLDFSRDSIVQQETELRELKNELSTVQATLENIDNLLARSKSTAKEKLLEAKRCCNNKLPQDPDFPYKEQFEVLPADVTALQEHYYELQTRMDCMEQGDEQVVKEYDEREKVIARLRAEVTHSSDTNKLLENKMQTLKQKWLPPLESLLRNIDKSFGDMFAKLGCAGEIKLEKAGSDEDYDKYGIGILVSFRASEALQRLTRHAQSGGERALCTALYLMALQALTTVPFRCVDEINQGMDPINERKMFQLLVKVTTECDNAQYFLLTPKLLTNLDYNEKVMVHTIMNGKKIMNYRKWKYQKFVEKAREYVAAS